MGIDQVGHGVDHGHRWPGAGLFAHPVTAEPAAGQQAVATFQVGAHRRQGIAPDLKAMQPAEAALATERPPDEARHRHQRSEPPQGGQQEGVHAQHRAGPWQREAEGQQETPPAQPTPQPPRPQLARADEQHVVALVFQGRFHLEGEALNAPPTADVVADQQDHGRRFGPGGGADPTACSRRSYCSKERSRPNWRS